MRRILLLLGLVASLMPAAAGAMPEEHAAPATHQERTVSGHDPAVGATHEQGTDAPAVESHSAGDSRDPGAEAHGEATHDSGPMLELPDLIHNLKVYFGSTGERPKRLIDYLFAWRGNIFALAILILICVLMLRGAAKREMIPGKFQNAVEYVVEAFYNFIYGILGRDAKEFVPFLGTLFLYIWFMNLSGLIPLLKAPTSLFETTLALALVVFLYVQVTGFRKLGFGGYLYHLVGSPQDVMGWALVPLMLPLHLVGEIAKPVSLSLRLFGNIMGEDVLIAVFTWLGVATLAAFGSPIGIPLEFPFIFLGLLLSTIQALVFTLLSTIYFSQMLPHEEEHGH